MVNKIIITLVLLVNPIVTFSQTGLCDIRSAVGVCLAMRSAINTGDMDGLKQSNNQLKQCRTAYFGEFRPVENQEELSLNGHFLFETEFVDSLLVLGKLAVYKYAQRYAIRSNRASFDNSCKVFMKNIAVGRDCTSTYKYRGFGHLELAVISEPGGLISVKAIDKTTGAVYKEYDDEKTGRPYRTLSFDLSPDNNTLLEIQITNHSPSDVSCVVIGN